MTQNKKHSDLIFEISWEVCNKVGGIYTVLSTKAKTMNSLFQDQVIFIGPDFGKENTSNSFKESPRLLQSWKKNNNLPHDIKVRVGRWDIPGRPMVILVDYKSLYSVKNELYSDIWNKYHVDSLHAYGDYDESCMFAYGAALVVESYAKYLNDKKTQIYAHFDEWTTGMGLLYLKSAMPDIATAFTTHATSIGRSICGNNKPLYDYMSAYNGDQMADELNMQSKHSLEKTAALEAGAFTTVSDVTAAECRQLIGRDPIVTPNGFELNFVPAKTQFAKKRNQARAKLLEVAKALTGADLPEDTLLVATSGRNEFRNKGLDAFIDSVNVLRSKWGNQSKKVVAFMMVPAWVKEARLDLQNKLNASSSEQLENRIITHDINNYNDDAIYGKMRYLNLNNNSEDNVHIIYVPSYLNGDDGIFNMSYYDLLIGLDCTVFASYYEPWGYTPMESVAFSVPTITTDLSGFGQWTLNEHGDGFDVSGVKVIHRTDSNYSEVVEQISTALYEYLSSDEEYKVKARKQARLTAESATWNNFMKHYEIAYNVAVESVKNL